MIRAEGEDEINNLEEVNNTAIFKLLWVWFDQSFNLFFLVVQEARE
jgi:hypothetical protein